jgi:hypothetical protein
LDDTHCADQVLPLLPATTGSLVIVTARRHRAGRPIDLDTAGSLVHDALAVMVRIGSVTGQISIHESFVEQAARRNDPDQTRHHQQLLDRLRARALFAASQPDPDTGGE